MIFCRLTVLATFACLAMTFSASEAAPLQPTEARIIDNFEQLGIDAPTPRFGWVVNDTARGAVQSAYQIIVARSPAALDNASDVAWDSGKIVSSQQYGVAYAGPALEKTTQYSWKVRTWDAQGNPSPWSDPRHFITSFFTPQDWNAQAVWIGDALGSITANPPQSPARNSERIPITKPIRAAYLYISGLGQFNAFINGGPRRRSRY